ncbi:MAG: SCO1664 family protein [Chloroflexota bacterium]
MVTNIDPITILTQGVLSVKGEFLWGSNYTFLAEVAFDDLKIAAVYKPNKGERPLWDFPTASLSRREVAAYLVSEALGWRLVPPTIYREKGPLGPGSLQLYIEHDPEYHYFNFSDEDRQRLRPVALFDLLINNADRKGSHVLKDNDGRLWLIDHGVCFHVEDKLRTVIWDFVGEPIPDDLCAALTQLAQDLKPVEGKPSPLALSLQGFLSRGEVRALAARASALATGDGFPPPDPYRRAFPWPQI